MKSSLFSSSSAFLLRRSWANILRRDISTLSSDSTADKKSVEEFLNKDLPNLDPNKGLPKPELVKKFFDPKCMNRKERVREELRETRLNFQRHDHDTGSSEVQAAALSKKIKALEWHMTRNRQDKAVKRTMQKLLDDRRKHLVYLRRKNFPAYCALIDRLNLPDAFVKQDRFALYKAKAEKRRYL